MSDLFFENKPLVPSTSVEDFLSPSAKVKPLSTQIDWVITHRQSEFLPNLIALQTHPSVAIRRKVSLGLAKLKAGNFIESIQAWQASESDRETWLNLNSTIDKLKRRQSSDSDDITEEKTILSVAEALANIKQMVGHEIYIIEGEITEPKNYGSTFYFGLKDDQDTRLECRIFAGAVQRLNFPLNEGLTIRVTGKFTISKASRLNFDIQKIELTGEGELLRNLQLLDRKLEQEGLFDPKNKRLIPLIPNNILLIASPNSAAIKDFIKVLSARRTGINIYHLPIKTQGVGAEIEILNQLELTNSICQQYAIETIVMTRGGGSKDDLFVFNSEKIVRAIHNLNRPIIVAIGHEQDSTLAEKAADLRASTPSNAAELASLSSTEILNSVYNHLAGIRTAAKSRTESYASFKDARINDINDLIDAQIVAARQISNRINTIMFDSLRQYRTELNGIINQAQAHTNQRFNFARTELQTFRFIPALINEQTNQFRQKFALISTQINLEDPKKVLAKGYTIIHQNDKIIERSTQINKHQAITIEFSDDRIKYN